MLICRRVNESWIDDITKFLIQNLSAVFATKSFNCNLAAMNVIIWIFMNFKIYSFKIRKHSWLLGNYKISKIELSIYALHVGMSESS